MLKKERLLYKWRTHFGYFVCPALRGKISHGFSTKFLFQENYNYVEKINYQKKIFCEALKISYRSIVPLHQIHSNKILIIKEHEDICPPSLLEYDGVVTDSPSVALSICTADCLPILLFEKKKKIIGAIHAGWKGTSLGILPKLLNAVVQEFDGRIENCLLLMGPSIRPCCFEIKEDVLLILQSRLSCWERAVQKVDNLFYFDLQMANCLQAIMMGVLKENIWSTNFCTCCQSGWFHSYRRDKDRAGRMLSIISSGG